MKNIIPILREKVIRWHRLEEKLNKLMPTMDEMEKLYNNNKLTDKQVVIYNNKIAFFRRLYVEQCAILDSIDMREMTFINKHKDTYFKGIKGFTKDLESNEQVQYLQIGE